MNEAPAGVCHSQIPKCLVSVAADALIFGVLFRELISLSRVRDVNLGGVYAPARAVLVTLWPLAGKKVGTDALMESLAAILGISVPWNNNLAWVCTIAVVSYWGGTWELREHEEVVHHLPVDTCVPLDPYLLAF